MEKKSVLGSAWRKPDGKEVSKMLSYARERGQGLVEYAFIILLVVLVVIAVVTLLGPIVENMYSTVNSRFPQ